MREHWTMFTKQYGIIYVIYIVAGEEQKKIETKYSIIYNAWAKRYSVF